MRASRSVADGSAVLPVLSKAYIARVLSHAHTKADTITLDSTARHRRRTVMNSDNGIEFLLDLPEARLLRHGEGLELDDGRVVEIVAAPEELLSVQGKDARHLLALAWQIGNRHLAAQISDDHILIRRDPVIEKMLIGLGGKVEKVEAPFDPEGGAYHQHEHHHD